ncbi:DeoR family transcriptional regulator [Halomarina litorea]|uniref:DeoR family transcriptional regulator n=1 Tax=Halomarina litorea TaxID=2961595 RepID=UPI0026E55B1C|nr:DeoR family transcriptional regulator [Halomarina sp. BCD28]
MLPAERKRTIVELVSENGDRSVNGLAESLGYSEATIRRDLRDLESEGRIEEAEAAATGSGTRSPDRSGDGSDDTVSSDVELERGGATPPTPNASAGTPGSACSTA